jgi:hypothetical protein
MDGSMTTPDACLLPPMSARAYHADPCDVPSLSASCAKKLLSESPLHAWLSHPKLGGQRSAPTEAMRRGSLLHALILEDGAGVVKIDADSYRTAAAKAQRDAAEAAGDVPVLASEYADAVAVADDVCVQLLAMGVCLDGESEVGIEWREESARGPIVCRGRMDHVWLHRSVVLDLKTCDNANPATIGKRCYDLGYDVQRAAYVSALRKLRPGTDPRFLFVFVEELPAGAPQRAIVQPVELDADFCAIGEKRWRRAVETWAACTESGVWPAYGEAGTVVDVSAPRWALMDEGLV